MGWTIYYSIEQNEANILGCFGFGTSLTLPEEINSCPVVRLGPSCFGEPLENTLSDDAVKLVEGPPPQPGAGNSTLKHLTLPRTIREMGDRALAHCTALVRLELPPALTRLGQRVFDHCRSLTRVSLPEGLTELPGYAFADCRSLETLTVPETVTAVGSQCFYNCTSLTGLALPVGLTSIGSGIFMNCSRVKTLSFPAGINASVLLADLYQKLEVTVYTEGNATRLLFPEYAYEFEDIVMPRQFRTITYGSGGSYRECITGERIDLELYDSKFRIARLEETPETVALLALFRLMTPNGLRPEAKERYLTYLKEHIDALGREIIRRDREEELEFLLIGCQLEPTHLDQLLACAEGQSSPVLVSRILEQKRRLLPSGADKVFDL
jgi:hypothetical protein